MEVDSPVTRAAIERDLRCYEERWSELCLLEAEAPYGVVSPKASNIPDLKRQGKCILEATLRRVRGCIEATWTEGFGRNIFKGDTVLLSSTHPSADKFAKCVVLNTCPGRLQLRDALPDVHFENLLFRIDVQVNYMPFYRVCNALSSFTSTLPGKSPSPLQVLLATFFGDSEQRRAINTVPQPYITPPVKPILRPLNDSQRRAKISSLTQQVSPIQGPPGTGKTQVAEAIIRVWKSLRCRGPVVGGAPFGCVLYSSHLGGDFNRESKVCDE